MPNPYRSAAAFKAALEAYLRKKAAVRQIPFATMQLKFVIERMIARLFHRSDPGWLLKGGLALDMRYRPYARTTKDIDLSILERGPNQNAPTLDELHESLMESANADLEDFLIYRVAPAKKDLANAPGGGGRFSCEAMILGKTYAKFHIDLGIGDPISEDPELLLGDDLVDFANFSPVMVLAISKAQQFAEKLHAYSFPWGDRKNTRTKDLVDMVLLLERGGLNSASVQKAISLTFGTRKTHPVPETLHPPPVEWKTEFVPMAKEADLKTTDYLAAFSILDQFWSNRKQIPK